MIDLNFIFFKIIPKKTNVKLNAKDILRAFKTEVFTK